MNPLTCSEQILATASAAKGGMTEEATQDLVRFFLSQMNPDGGFRGRSLASDLYYTVFGLDGLLALGSEVPTEILRDYVMGAAGGQDLDLIHLSCLARCRSRLFDRRVRDEAQAGLLRQIEAYRTSDGGYAIAIGEKNGSIYASFLAFMAYQDLGIEAPSLLALGEFVSSRKKQDGSYANDIQSETRTTSVTAAAVVLLSSMGFPVEADVGEELLRRHIPGSGLAVGHDVPIPDLLATGTGLYALRLLGAPVDRVRESCLDFVEGLWNPEGGFCGTPGDPTSDCEFTFYGLLALGTLLQR